MLCDIFVVLLGMAVHLSAKLSTVPWLPRRFSSASCLPSPSASSVPSSCVPDLYLLDVVSNLCDGKECAVDTRVPDLLAVVPLVQLLQGAECRYPRSFQSVQLVDFFSQGMADLFEKGRGEQALVLLAEKLGQEAMCLKGLVSEEEKRQRVGHCVALAWRGW